MEKVIFVIILLILVLAELAVNFSDVDVKQSLFFDVATETEQTSMILDLNDPSEDIQCESSCSVATVKRKFVGSLSQAQLLQANIQLQKQLCEAQANADHFQRLVIKYYNHNVALESELHALKKTKCVS